MADKSLKTSMMLLQDHMTMDYISYSHSHAEQIYPVRFQTGFAAFMGSYVWMFLPVDAGCSVWENLGQSAELTHFWYHPTTYLWHDGRLLDRDRQEHISTNFPQQLKNTHSLRKYIIGLTRAGDEIGGSITNWLAPGVKSLHQIMCTSCARASVRSLTSIRVHWYNQMARSIP